MADAPVPGGPDDVSAMFDAWLASDDAEPVAEPTAPEQIAQPPVLEAFVEPPVEAFVEPPVEAMVAPPVVEAAETPLPASLFEAVAALDRAQADHGRGETERARAISERPDQTRYVLFTVAGAQYAVHQVHVTELDRVPAVTRVPNVPAWVRGITNRRGDVLSVIDLRILLGLERLAANVGRLLVVRLLDDSCSLGMMVDDVQQIVSVADGDIRPVGTALDGALAPCMTGLFEWDQRTVAVLDLDRLLRSSTIRQFDEPTDVTVNG